jgi:hypothetical protein
VLADYSHLHGLRIEGCIDQLQSLVPISANLSEIAYLKRQNLPMQDR